MVSISRRQLKRHSQPLLGHYHHGHHHSSALAVLGLGACLLLVWTWMDSFDGMGNTHLLSIQLQKSRLQRREETLQHPKLRVVAEDDLGKERFNAVALDILGTLDCVNLFNQNNNKQDENKQDGDSNNEGVTATSRRRRLQEEESNKMRGSSSNNNKLAEEDVDEEEEEEDNNNGLFNDSGDFSDTLVEPSPTARHLFCVAAMAPMIVADSAQEQGLDPEPGAVYWNEKIHCDATGSKQRALLDLWSSARSNFGGGNKPLLRSVLDLATEQERTLVQHTLHLWLPDTQDDGTQFSIDHINNQQLNADHGGIHGLSHNLGPGKTFVDVGSAFGITSLAVSLLYPGTQVVSIEAAPPNWLIQELNWICAMENADNKNNDEEEADDHHGSNEDEAAKEKKSPSSSSSIRVLAGVGPVQGGPQFAPMMWRRSAPTATRSWSTETEIHRDQDVEIDVQLKSWHSILAEAGLDYYHNNDDKLVDVLNVDCEGCEYNLIPDMSQEEFESIGTVIGDVHWGYIPKSKKPSSQRAELTHHRLCTHENMARTAKECCAFPDLPVTSSVPGQVLFRENDDEDEEDATAAKDDTASTSSSLLSSFSTTTRTKPLYAQKAMVRDVAGEFCNGFDEWAAERDLFTIPSDWGWFRLTSTAAADGQKD